MLLEQVQPSPRSGECVCAGVVTTADIEIATSARVGKWNNTAKISPSACAPANIEHGGQYTTTARGRLQHLPRTELLENFVGACAGGRNAGAACDNCAVYVKSHISPHKNTREKAVVRIHVGNPAASIRVDLDVVASYKVDYFFNLSVRLVS